MSSFNRGSIGGVTVNDNWKYNNPDLLDSQPSLEKNVPNDIRKWSAVLVELWENMSNKDFSEHPDWDLIDKVTFYYYSSTDRRCVLQQEDNGKEAYDLILVGDVKDLSRRSREEGRYIITSDFGKTDKEKLESRHFQSLSDAIGWGEWVQQQNPRKSVRVWRIVKFYLEDNHA